MKATPLLLVLILAGSAWSQNSPDPSFDPAQALANAKKSAVAAPTPAATPVAQGKPDLDRFLGVFAIVSCQTEWKKGDWSLWDYNNSQIHQILPDRFSAADAKTIDGTNLTPLATKIVVERKNDPDGGVSLLIHGADAGGAPLYYGRGQPSEMSFERVNKDPEKTGDQDWDTSAEVQCPEPGTSAYPMDPSVDQGAEKCQFTKFPTFDRHSTGHSLGTVLARTNSGGWVVTQKKGDSEGTRTAITGYTHHSNIRADSVENSLELSADGRLTYHVREHGELNAGGTDWRGKRVKTEKWDVTQDCVFQRDRK